MSKSRALYQGKHDMPDKHSIPSVEVKIEPANVSMNQERGKKTQHQRIFIRVYTKNRFAPDTPGISKHDLNYAHTRIGFKYKN